MPVLHVYLGSYPAPRALRCRRLAGRSVEEAPVPEVTRQDLGNGTPNLRSPPDVGRRVAIIHPVARLLKRHDGRWGYLALHRHRCLLPSCASQPGMRSMAVCAYIVHSEIE
mmetsp:Transcript_7256/g.22440  ORF Transcript_7256/g.22440 Transcript_7256/m.22440 type:complete len:111 (+) Transcript_7256:1614-1946(+)